MRKLSVSAAALAAAAAARVPADLERKDASSASAMIAEIKSLFDEKGQMIAAHAEKIAALEGKAGDVVTRAELAALNTKLATIDSAITSAEKALKLAEKAQALAEEATLAGQRGAGLGAESADDVAHRKAFSGFMRKGADAGLAELQTKSLNVTTDAEGGYAVPQALDRAIHALLVEVSPMRELSTVIENGQGYEKLVNLRGTASGWAAETGARAETTAPSLAKLSPPHGDLFAHPYATKQMLDNAFFDVESWLRDEVATAFAAAEGAAYTSGDGTNKPKGFLAYTMAATADGVRAFGSIQYIASGAAGAWAASDPEDVLFSTLFAMKAGHRARSTWQMNSATAASLRGLKDSTGRSLWVDSMALGLPNLLIGRPVVFNEDMPDIAADALAIALGDWKAGYQVVDMGPTTVIRDPYSAKPYVTFYTAADRGGQVVDSEAIKVVKFALS